MIELSRTDVAGSYRGENQGLALNLRIDVGAGDSLDIVSGDLETENGPGTFDHHHSFQSRDLVVQPENGVPILRGTVKVFRDDIADLARMDVRIPETGNLLATYTFFRLTPFGRETLASFDFPLQRTSGLFRRVELEVDQVQGVPLPQPFRTHEHADTPGDLPPRLIDFAAAYRDAGVDLAVTLGGQDVPVNRAGFDGLWTDEELHAAMEGHFAGFANQPQWRLYLLLATRYENPDVLGIMFDSGDEAPRQGAAVFAEHPAIANAADAERDREYLYTIVHELGHAFNLLHSFQKGIFETHGVVPRPASLSWMNYPQLFPFGSAGPDGWDGSSSFWPQFRFGFDLDELIHLRHDDSLEVIMGGRDFGFAGHLEEHPFQPPSAVQDLSLTLWLPPVVEFLQQVEGDVRLRNDGQATVPVHPSLHPAGHSLDLLIRRPGDKLAKVYRHFTTACMRGEHRALAPGEAIYQELSPNFGQRHWFIDEPGTYEVQAVYRSPDGRRLYSNKRRVRVLVPESEADRVAQDFFNNDTGVYLGVEGSRSDTLDKTRAMLADVCDRLESAPITRQIQLANAVRDTRVFKDVSAGKVVEPDDAAPAEALLRSYGVTAKRRKVKVDPSQSHLRVARHLACAARGFAAVSQPADAQRAVAAVEGFLQSIQAPQAAAEPVVALKKELKIS